MNAIQRLLRRRDLTNDLSSEIAGHIEEKTQALIAEGKSPQDASFEARRAFGNIASTQELSRDAWGWRTGDDLWQDLRYAARVLRKTPAFTVTAVVVLALGIGMNTAIFTAVKAVLLSGLPYPEPERLMSLSQTARDGHPMSVSGPDGKDWRAQNRTFAAMALYGEDSAAVSGEFAPRQERMAVVSGDFFRTMAVQPLAGRSFDKEESHPGGRPAAVISYSLATAVYGDARAAMKRAIRMNGMAFTVIGIMPPGFDFPERAQLWISEEAFADNDSRSAHNYRVIGRLKDNVTPRQAQADMEVIASRLAKSYADDKDQGIRVSALYDQLVGPFRPALLVLLCAVGCVLLIACANISNLQLARATARTREMALRTALGAARTRLIRQLLTESVLLAGMGGSAGLALAFAGCALLRHYAPANIPRIETMRIDAPVLLFSMALSLGAGILFGLLPALAASRADVNDALKEGSGKATAGPHLKSWSKILVIVEIGLAVVLLSGAALLLRSLWKLDHVDSGLRSAGVFTAELTWPINSDGDGVNPTAAARASRQIIERVSALPSVQAVGMITTLPVQNSGANGDFEIEGIPLPADPHDAPDAWYRAATAGYFQALGLPILAGRNFTEADDRSSNQVALVNRSFARTFFRSGGVLGRRIRFMGFDRKPQFMTVVGVVPDARAFGLNKPARAEVFVDYLQHAGSSLQVTLTVQAPAGMQDRIRAIVSQLNHDTPIEFQAMDSVISSSLSREHFQTACLSLFAGFALLLAAVGIYGLLSYTVSSRTGEFGIRMALGARRGDVLRLVLGEGITLAAAGLAVGLLAALVCTRTLGSFLYEISPADPAAYLGIAAVFTLTALLGCFLPARRAANIDPNSALRNE